MVCTLHPVLSAVIPPDFPVTTIAEPSTIAGDTFNLVALQHSDENCTDPTGAEEIISQDIFGYDAGCTNFGGASSDSLFECRDDGSSIAQTFTSVDTSCTGDVVSEYVAYIQRTFACLEFEGFFYRCVCPHVCRLREVSCIRSNLVFIVSSPRVSPAIRSSYETRGWYASSETNRVANQSRGAGK